jgi:hypothetical protein
MVLMCWMCGGDLLDDWKGYRFILPPSFMMVDMVGRCMLW